MGTAAYHRTKLKGGTGCLTPGRGQPHDTARNAAAVANPEFRNFRGDGSALLRGGGWAIMWGADGIGAGLKLCRLRPGNGAGNGGRFAI